MNQYEHYLNRLKDKTTNPKGMKAALEYMNGVKKLSMRDIAKLLNTSPNSISRMFKKYGAESLSTSEIIRKKIKNGSIVPNHPEWTEEQKLNFSEKTAKSWENNPNRNDSYKEEAREKWNALTEAEKKKQSKKMLDGVREASKNGSRLEHVLAEEIRKFGFLSIKHKVNVLPNSDLEFDLYIPEIGTIIEVDGPSHYSPIWGEERLKKNKERDAEKAGSAINMKFNFIRVIQSKNTISQIYVRTISKKLIDCLERIKRERLSAYYEEIV